MHTVKQKMILWVLCFCGLWGCSQSPVQPWERDWLAKPEMQLRHPFDTGFDEHIYFSKESSSGGAGFAAGGCGCN